MSDLVKLIRDLIKWSLIISFAFIAIVIGANVEHSYNGPAREAAKKAAYDLGEPARRKAANECVDKLPTKALSDECLDLLMNVEYHPGLRT